MLDAVIISDLHLGSDLCQTGRLLDFLESLIDGRRPSRKLIINGDLFERPTPGRFPGRSQTVVRAIRRLATRLHVVCVIGNHDGTADELSRRLGGGLEVLPGYIFESGNRTVLCRHGHTFDSFLEDHPWLTWFGDVAYLILQKVDRSHRLAIAAKLSSKHFLRCMENVQRGAINEAVMRRCQIVCCGHTHMAAARPGGISYYNSGSWVEHDCTWLTLKDGLASLVHAD